MFWIQFARMGLLKKLNEYASLLAATGTFVYVFLTFQMLRALKRESTREHRLRHLEDIKRQVAQPTREWLKSVVIPMLTGNTPSVLPKNVLKPKSHVTLGEPGYEIGRELASEFIAVETTSSQLFLHAKEEHFPGELSALARLVDQLTYLFEDCLSFVKSCADKMANNTPLPRVPTSPVSGEFADSDFLAAICFSDLLGRRVPEFRVNIPAVGGMEVSTNTGRMLARGPSDSVRAWSVKGVELIVEEWRKGGLPKRVAESHVLAIAVSTYLARLELTYDLIGNCKFVGGRGPGLASRVRRRLGVLWSRLWQSVMNGLPFGRPAG